jgi:hypothetical protein
MPSGKQEIDLLAEIVLIATAITGKEPHFPKGAAMRYSDYPAFVACLRESPESSANDRTRVWYCIDKVVTDRVEREKNKVRP